MGRLYTLLSFTPKSNSPLFHKVAKIHDKAQRKNLFMAKNPNKPKKTSQERRKTLNLFLLLMVLVAMLTGAFLPSSEKEAKEVSLTKVLTAIQKDGADETIKTVSISEGSGVVKVEWEDKDKKPIYASYPYRYGEAIIDKAEAAKVDIKVEPITMGGWSDTLFNLMPLFLLGIIVWFVIASGSMGGKGNFSKAIGERPDVTFDDVAGNEEAEEDIKEIVSFLRDPDRYARLGAKPPKGALLVGPPGTGKTLLAKAVAGEAGVPFFATSGSDFQDMWVGSGTRRIRKLFSEANKVGPAIIFIDELDGVGGKRSSDTRGVDQEHNRTVNALLTEMDGFRDSKVIVLAATNNPDKLDSALTRPGRFDRKVIVDLPDWKGRLAILNVHVKGKSLDPDVQLELIAKGTTGASGADLANLVNEALIFAGRNGRDAANHADFMEALSLVTIGRARKSRVMTPDDKKIVAAHEAGHAIVGLAMKDLPDPTHVTIIPRGMSGGHTKLQESENVFQTRAQLKARMAMTLGGMVAEKRTLGGEFTQGPGHDLQAATETATRMVTQMGMGERLAVVDGQTSTVNDTIGGRVNNEVEVLLNEALQTANEVFTDPKWVEAFDKMVELLLSEDTIEVDKIQEIKGIGTT